MTTAAPTACRHWLGEHARYCDTTNQVRLYLPGTRCPLHTPAALSGRPEPLDAPSGSRWWVRPDGTVIPPAP